MIEPIYSQYNLAYTAGNCTINTSFLARKKKRSLSNKILHTAGTPFIVGGKGIAKGASVAGNGISDSATFAGKGMYKVITHPFTSSMASILGFAVSI